MDPTCFAKKVFSLVSVVCVTREIALTLKKESNREAFLRSVFFPPQLKKNEGFKWLKAGLKESKMWGSTFIFIFILNPIFHKLLIKLIQIKHEVMQSYNNLSIQN